MTEEKKLTGYPSVDKPWLKYYREDAISAPLPGMSAYAYLKQQNAQRLDFPAIESDMGCFTYGELFAQIDATARALWAMGVRKGDHILSMFPVLPHETFLFYGIDAVGAALCQIAPQYTATEVCDFCNRMNTNLFFVFDLLLTPEMEQMVYEHTTVRQIVVVNSMPRQCRDTRTLIWEDFLAMGKDVELPEVPRNTAEDVLFFASTGGSTGEPKSVMLSANCFNITTHQLLLTDLDYSTRDRWMRLWPIFSASAAVANHHLPLCAGMHCLLRQFPLDLSGFDKMILEDRPNHLILIPQLLDVLEASELLKDQDLSYVKTAGCGGLALTAQFEERVNKFFADHNIQTFLGYGWGSTEASTTSANRTNWATTTIGTAGAPMMLNLIAAFDCDTCEELPYGREGELCVNSPNLMLGYYNDPELSAKVLRTHADGKVWLHTGDLGKVSEDGLITITGRMTRVIFTFPTAKIYPQALEGAVSRVEGVREVVFCQIPDREHDGFFCPVCFVVPDDMKKADAIRENIRAYCEKNFPAHACPKHIFMRQCLPLTGVGKPDVRALEKEAAQMQ